MQNSINIFMIKALTEAQAIKTKESAKAAAFNRVLKQFAASYTTLNNKLMLNWQDDLIQFMLANELTNMGESISSLFMGIDNAIVKTS